MDSQTLMDRSRERCAAEHDGRDWCQLCIQAEIVEMIYEAHPEFCRADAEDVVSEWILNADEPTH